MRVTLPILTSLSVKGPGKGVASCAFEVREVAASLAPISIVQDAGQDPNGRQGEGSERLIRYRTFEGGLWANHPDYKAAAQFERELGLRNPISYLKDFRAGAHPLLPTIPALGVYPPNGAVYDTAPPPDDLALASDGYVATKKHVSRVMVVDGEFWVRSPGPTFHVHTRTGPWIGQWQTGPCPLGSLARYRALSFGLDGPGEAATLAGIFDPRPAGGHDLDKAGPRIVGPLPETLYDHVASALIGASFALLWDYRMKHWGEIPDPLKEAIVDLRSQLQAVFPDQRLKFTGGIGDGWPLEADEPDLPDADRLVEPLSRILDLDLYATSEVRVAARIALVRGEIARAARLTSDLHGLSLPEHSL